jgi:tagatose 6-phosphate kinase
MILSVCLNSSLDTRYNIPGFALGGIFSSLKPHITAGGKGFNLARVAALLGEETCAIGLVGTREELFFADSMAEVGASARLITTQNPTRRCLNIVDPSSNSSTQVLEAGCTVEPEELSRLLELCRESAMQAQVICASGSVPPGVPDDIYATLGQLARRLGKPFLLDARGLHFKEGLAGRPFAAKPNLEELEAHVGHDLASLTDLKCALRELGKAVELPIVSMGAQGAAFLWEDRFYTIQQPVLEAVNAVGSGDAFMAGLAAGLNRGWDIRRSMKLAAACGMSNATKETTGTVCPRQIETLSAQVVIHPEGGF